MSANAQRFAEEVLAAFRAARLFSGVEIAKAGGPSTTTITNLRKAAKGEVELPKPRNDTMRRIEAAAGWRDGSANVLWDTGELPDAELSRAIGTGGVPVGSPELNEIASRVEVDQLGDQIVIVTSRGEISGTPTSLEIRYAPGSGREANILDLGGVASSAHRAAAALTYRKGTRPSLVKTKGGEEHAGSPATTTPAPGPADQPGERHLHAARTEVSKGKARRRASDDAGEGSQDPGGMSPS